MSSSMPRIPSLLSVACLFLSGSVANVTFAKTEARQIPRQTLTLKPTREDITVGSVILSFNSSDLGARMNLNALRVNGIIPRTSRLYLKQVARNRFEIPAMRIECDTAMLGGPLYITLKAWFNEVTNQKDGLLYTHLPDRYALVSYCTDEDDDPTMVNARLGANRVASFEEFLGRLQKPFVIALKRRQIPKEWGYPMRSGRQLSEMDFKEIERAMYGHGETWLAYISETDLNRATVGAGTGTVLPATRVFQVVRRQGRWHVEGVSDVARFFPTERRIPTK